MDKKSRIKSITILSVIWILWVALMYYIFLPAVNIHSGGFWVFVIFVCLLPAGLLMLCYDAVKAENMKNMEPSKVTAFTFLSMGVLGLLAVVLLVIGSPMFHASAYANILVPEEADFQKDISSSIEVSNIALMDTDSAILFGNREIGSLSDVVSQYNVSENYTQIDYQGSPKKVSALDYVGFFKYMGNKDKGIPGYVTVDPVGQSAEYVALKEGMNYVPSAYFGKDLKRHLRAEFPTAIFGNTHFEIDEEGNPFYVSSVYEYKVGVFGGKSVKGVIICDPISGDCTYYDTEDIPRWVDVAYDGNLLVTQYNWNGKLTNGFMNSLFGKKGCKKCTETVARNVSNEDDEDDEDVAADFGYIAKDGDIWIYTGITSVNDDASNIGFLMVNERTSQARYYTMAGADESSAMAAAEGEVQEKGYKASFPSLINVDGQPTYVMVLKDASGIVKLYAMVNVESYNMVTTAGDLDTCFAQYRKLLGIEETESVEESSSEEPVDENEETVPVEFVVQSIQYVDIDGNTYVYLIGEDGKAYKQKFADNENLVFVHPGDTVSAECVQESEQLYRIKTMQ